MTLFPAHLIPSSGPRYVAIADAIEAAVTSGDLRQGDRLPAHRPLAFDLGVTVGTISRAYELAARRGLVEGSVGRGTFVRGIADPGRQTRGAGSAEFSAMRDVGLIPMRTNLPAPVGHNGAVAAAMETLLRDPAFRTRIADYEEPAGSASQRAAMASWLSLDGFTPDTDRLVLTAGAQQALATAIAVATDPGDLILTEALTYRIIASQCQLMGRRLRPVAIDGEGLVPDALEEAARTHRARAVFLIPTLHNPTGAIMSTDRRRAIASIAEDHDLMLLEDDTYGVFTDAQLPITALLPDRSFYVSSLSKSVAPGLRIGAMLCPPRHAARARAAQHALGQGLPPMTAECARHLIETGEAHDLLTRQKVEIRKRNKMAANLLRPWLPDIHPHSAHLWLPVPEVWRVHDFVEAARMRGVAIAADEDFAITAPSGRRHVRITLGPPADMAECRRGISLVKDLLEEGPLSAA